MTTRFKAGDPFGVPSGYEGANIPTSFELPPVGIDDVDRALFNFFDNDLQLMVSSKKSGQITKVPVIFAAGEKWAMLKKGRALRDPSGALILPLITIHRKDIAQDVKNDIVGRGINQQTGELVIKRRLATTDRAYQNIINKLGIPNQQNLSSATSLVDTTRNTAENSQDLDVIQGALLAPKHGNNIWEIITIPSPQFFTITYELTFWTQYVQHANQIMTKMMSAYLPTANGTFKLETPAGYWFIAKVENNQFTAEDNAEDSSGEERIIKHKAVIKVAGYAVVSDAPGAPKPIRRFYSAPIVSFSLENSAEDLIDGVPAIVDPYSGSDDPSLGFSLDGSIQPRERATQQETQNRVMITKNPFTGREETEYVRVINRDSRNGESILRPDDGLTIKIV